MNHLILEERHMLSILVYLRTCGDSTARKTDIYNAVSANPRMPIKLDALERAGLISQRYEDCSRSTWVTLTESGVQVADRLLDIDSIMGATA